MEDGDPTNWSLAVAHAMVRKAPPGTSRFMGMPPRLHEACPGTYPMLRAIGETEDRVGGVGKLTPTDLDYCHRFFPPSQTA
ncbi:hypothetical protein [Streptodolium elevatio]